MWHQSLNWSRTIRFSTIIYSFYWLINLYVNSILEVGFFSSPRMCCESALVSNAPRSRQKKNNSKSHRKPQILCSRWTSVIRSNCHWREIYIIFVPGLTGFLRNFGCWSVNKKSKPLKWFCISLISMLSGYHRRNMFFNIIRSRRITDAQRFICSEMFIYTQPGWFWISHIS